MKYWRIGNGDMDKRARLQARCVPFTDSNAVGAYASDTCAACGQRGAKVKKESHSEKESRSEMIRVSK